MIMPAAMFARRLARVGKTLDRSTIAIEISISMPAPSRTLSELQAADGSGKILPQRVGIHQGEEIAVQVVEYCEYPDCRQQSLPVQRLPSCLCSFSFPP